MLLFVLWAAVLSSCQRGTTIVFYSGSKSRIGFRETQALSRMFASGSEAHFAAKDLVLCSRRAPLQAGSSVQRISACSWRRLARALRVTQVERTMFVERTRALEIGAASADAPHKRDPRRQVSDEANLSRVQRVRWWLGLGANRLFCQTLTVITELPVVVLDDNATGDQAFWIWSWPGTTQLSTVSRRWPTSSIVTLRWPSSNRPLGKPDN